MEEEDVAGISTRDALDGPLLRRRRGVRGGRRAGAQGEGIAIDRLAHDGRQPALHQPIDDALRDPEPLDDVLDAGAPAGGLEELVQLALTARALEEHVALHQ